MKNNNILGFTLLELLITIGIISVLVAISIPSFNRYGRTNELAQIANTMKSAIQTTKNYAFSPTILKAPWNAQGQMPQEYDEYKIVFKSNPPNYTIYERQASGLVELESATYNASDYTLILPGNQNTMTIAFSISGKGKMIMPSGKEIITLVGNKISGVNKVEITVDPASGQIVVGQIK